jgi:hypothetical protein
MYVSNGSHFELEVLGETTRENLAEKFGNQKPNFGKDLREIVSWPHQDRFPKTRLAESLYNMVEKRLKALNVSVAELRFISTVGTMIDLYREADCVFYMKTADGQEAVVSIDLFFIENRLIGFLKELWIETSTSDVYSQENFHYDLLRYSRTFSELKKRHIEIDFPEELGEVVRSEDFKRLWASDYVPQEAIFKVDPERGKTGYQNQLVVTPSQIINHRDRKALAQFIAELLFKQVRVLATRL